MFLSNKLSLYSPSLLLEASRPPDVAASLRGKRRGGAWPGNPLLPIPGAGAQHGGLGGDRRARIQRINRGIPSPRVAETLGIHVSLIRGYMRILSPTFTPSTDMRSGYQ